MSPPEEIVVISCPGIHLPECLTVAAIIFSTINNQATPSEIAGIGARNINPRIIPTVP